MSKPKAGLINEYASTLKIAEVARVNHKNVTRFVNNHINELVSIGNVHRYKHKYKHGKAVEMVCLTYPHVKYLLRTMPSARGRDTAGVLKTLFPHAHRHVTLPNGQVACVCPSKKSKYGPPCKITPKAAPLTVGDHLTQIDEQLKDIYARMSSYENIDHSTRVRVATIEHYLEGATRVFQKS
jgi:hypothetical protein